ncbi:nuclear pore glycoprotein p62 [Copidosoma floridanum]|uniref:nuclear pore glycoprotein p62 n=1 Tax=Copidosoma floridanum TaxID=29053 RepID=UPI0006C954BA|nr:nuclear pore glycoprotein p62 [Copidosoma floridanum]
MAFNLGGGTPANTATTGFSLLNNPANTTSNFNLSTTTATTASGFNLGGAPSTGTTGFSLGGSSAPASTGFNLGGVPAATASTGFSFGTPSTAATSSTTPSLGVAAASGTPASTGFNLGGSTAVGTTSFSLGGTAPANTAASLLTLGKTTSTSTPTIASAISQPQTSLGATTTVSTSSASKPSGAINFCQLEECINKWTLELEEQEKVFVNQATQINAWDRLLIANGEKIITLNQEVERVKLEQQQLEHELDYVVGQQKELQDCLVPLEKELSTLSVTDPEREYTYRLAENIDTQLKQMSEDLKEIIEHLNEANRAQDSSDPIVQIVKILNAHMNSLQWLVQRTNLLSSKIQQVDQMHQSFRQENERTFSLAYN